MPPESPSTHSLVTAILPRQNADRVICEVLAAGAPNAMSAAARGTLMHERWYQSLLPAISPEQEVVQFLVPDVDVDRLMEHIVVVGNLRMSGAGAIFAVPCRDLACSGDFPLWTPGSYRFESVAFDIRFKTDLVAVLHVTDRGAAAPVARAALRAGAPGATITFVRGYGLRDRLGLLRITKSHEKELIVAVVDRYDLDAVFDAMAQAGHVDQPGRGLIFQVPISRGLTNLASVFQPWKHSATVQQMVRAIDQLQGSSDWRANPLHVHDPRNNDFATTPPGTRRGLKLLGVIAQRKDADHLLQSLLELGASGASVSNLRLTEADCRQTRGGLRMHREFARIDVVLNPAALPALRSGLDAVLSDPGLGETCLFTHDIPSARTFSPIG